MTNPRTITIGTVSAKRGEKRYGALATFDMRDGTPVDIPVLIANGAKGGPIIAACCGVHANESIGTVGIIDVFNMLDPKEMSGAFVGVPVVTPTAFQHGWRYNPLDLGVPREPGHPKGNISERMADAVYSKVIEPADIYFSFHSNFNPCIAYTDSVLTTDEEINKQADKIAKSSGLTNINCVGVKDFPPQPRAGRPLLPPKVTVHMEFEGSGTMERREIRAARKAILNMCKTAGLLEGELEEMKGDCIKIEAPKGYGFAGYIPPELGFLRNQIRANRGGIVIKEADDAFIGRKIKEGTVIARIINLYGQEVETIKAPCDGYIWAWPLRTVYGLQTPAVYTGAEIAYWFTEKELREPYKSMYS
jgi:predicted deacylase